MSYDLIGNDPYDVDVSGEDFDDGGIAGDLEIIGGYDLDDAVAGLSDAELDVIAGLEDDLGVLAGYETPTDEVTRLLQATAGLSPLEQLARRLPNRRGAGVRPGPGVPSAHRRAAAARVARRVHTLGRAVQRERQRTSALVNQLRRVRATTPQRLAASSPPAAAMQTVPAAGGGAHTLVERQPTRSNKLPLGINSNGAVAAGTTVQISVQPQVLFRPTRYFVSQVVGDKFRIDSITIGKDNQFATSGPLPASSFSDPNLTFNFDTCQPGQSIVVSVTNITAADAIFMSSMWGDSVQ